MTVIKRNGVKEPYQRDKLELGLRRALQKRPYSQDQFKKLINTIERDIQKKKKDEVTSQFIGEQVMKRLKSFDKVSYIRFASVYRAFEDVKTFQKELEELLNKKNSKVMPGAVQAKGTIRRQPSGKNA